MVNTHGARSLNEDNDDDATIWLDEKKMLTNLPDTNNPNEIEATATLAINNSKEWVQSPR